MRARVQAGGVRGARAWRKRLKGNVQLHRLRRHVWSANASKPLSRASPPRPLRAHTQPDNQPDEASAQNTNRTKRKPHKRARPRVPHATHRTTRARTYPRLTTASRDTTRPTLMQPARSRPGHYQRKEGDPVFFCLFRGQPRTGCPGQTFLRKLPLNSTIYASESSPGAPGPEASGVSHGVLLDSESSTWPIRGL
jgi:hypothetical protein